MLILAFLKRPKEIWTLFKTLSSENNTTTRMPSLPCPFPSLGSTFFLQRNRKLKRTKVFCHFFQVPFVFLLFSSFFISFLTWIRWYVDPSFPECGFLTRDEAHILYNAALIFKGQNALEIGSHVGWSTVHFGLGGKKNKRNISKKIQNKRTQKGERRYFFFFFRREEKKKYVPFMFFRCLFSVFFVFSAFFIATSLIFVYFLSSFFPFLLTNFKQKV